MRMRASAPGRASLATTEHLTWQAPAILALMPGPPSAARSRAVQVPWGPRGEVFLQSLERGCPLAALRWMAAHGCHVDWARVGWAAAVGAATCQADPRVVDWLRTERRRARSLWGWVVGLAWGWVEAMWRRVAAWEVGGGGGWEAWRESPNPGDGTRIE